MRAWFLKQLVQIMARYVIALLAGIVVGSVSQFLITSGLSNSYFAKLMILTLFLLMTYSVVVWHLVAQLLLLRGAGKRHIEIQSASITVVLAFGCVVVWLPEITSVTAIDITLFVSTFTVAAGLCGYTMDWLKSKGII